MTYRYRVHLPHTDVSVSRIGLGWTLHDLASSSRNDLAVFALSDCIAGQSLTVSAGSGRSSRKFKLRASDGAAHTSAPGTPWDPTMDGARLVVTDAASMGVLEIDLPAQNWDAKRGGFSYRDNDGSEGPGFEVKVKRGKIVAKCKGPSWISCRQVLH